MIRSTAGRLSDRRREGVWPRVYRLRRGQRVFLLGLAAVAILGGLAGAVAVIRDSKEPPAIALIPLAFTLLGALLVAIVRTGRIVLYEDAIEIVELGKGRRRLRRDQLAGFRLVPTQYGQAVLVLQPRDPAREPVKAHWAHETDPLLDAWLGSLPDLDAADRARAEAELLRSPAMGTPDAARARALARARTIARLVNGAAVAACAWGWLYPRPYRAAIATLAIVPPIAIALMIWGRGRYAADEQRNDPRPNLAIALLGPGLVLAIRALQDVQLVDHAPLLAGGGAAAVAIALLLAAADPALRKIPWVPPLLALLVLGYPWGGLVLANALLDRAAPQPFAAQVLGKEVSSGRQADHELRLAPWGPTGKETTVTVDQALFRSVEPGDTVCVSLRPGALGARWYLVRACAGSGR